MADETLQLDGLQLAAGARCLVQRLCVTLRIGQRWAVVGPNGAGKSTLLAAVAGLARPVAGEVRYDGKALHTHGVRALARRRAYLPQRVDDAFSSTVLETVLLARHPHGAGWGFATADDEAVARDALAAFDALHLAGRDVQQLSGGERQRVALATALAQDTPVLLLDEPTTHLDVKHQIQALDRLAQQPAKLVVAVLHDMQLAARFASHALLLDGRGNALAGPAADVLQEAPLSQAFGIRFRRLQQGSAVVFWADGTGD